jgi:hypothetical protein
MATLDDTWQAAGELSAIRVKMGNALKSTSFLLTAALVVWVRTETFSEWQYSGLKNEHLT